MTPERYVAVHSSGDRADAAAFLARALRIDDSGVARIARRGDGLLGFWSQTGFDVLATRSVFGTMSPADLVCDAQMLHAALTAAAPREPMDPGMSLDSAWRGALPPTAGYRHLDDVPARAIIELSREGARVAQDEGSAHGPARSLLDQQVLEVSAADGDGRGEVSMRMVFALTAMGFVRDAHGREITSTSPVESIGADEPVRVRMSASWLRLDARYGSIFRRRHNDLDVSVV